MPQKTQALRKQTQLHDGLKHLIPIDLLDTVTTIADKRANKTAECSHTGHQQATLSRQRELSEPTKDNIRSRIASTIQSASLHDSNLTIDQQDALKRLKNNDKWNLNCGWF